jgi:cell division protein FtsZ
VAAAEMAISSPLLEASIDGAHGVLLSIQGGSDLGLFEINEAAQLVANSAAVDANIIFGAVIDDALGDEVRVTVIAAGFDEARPGRPAASAPLTVSRSSGSSGSGSSSAPAASSASAVTSAPTNGRADQNAPSAASAGQDGRSQDSRTGASSPTPASAAAAWGGTPAPSSPAPTHAPTPTPAPVTAPAVTSSVSAASADPGVAVPAQSGGDGASSGYVPSPVSFVTPDSDDDEEYGGKPATSYGSWDRDRERESEATSATGPSNWKDPGRPSKQDTVFDVTAGRRRPVVFEEDDDLDVPDFLK